MNLAQNTDLNNKISLPELEDKHETWLKQLTQIESADITIHPDCKICNLLATVRAEAELKWEQTHKISVVVHFLNQWSDSVKNGMNFNSSNVSNHMRNHYEEQERRLWMREYAQRLAEVMNYKINQDHVFSTLSSALQLQFMTLAADPTMDKSKKTTAMVSLAKTLTEIIEMQAKLKGDLKSSHVLAEKFVNVWVTMVTQETDPNRQKLLLDSLNTFREEISQIEIVDS